MPSTTTWTPVELADRWTERILAPAVHRLSEGGPRFTERKASRGEQALEGIERHAIDDFVPVFRHMGAKQPALATYIEGGRAYARALAERAAGADGRVAVAALPESLRADWQALAELEAPPAPEPPDPAAGYTWSERVLAQVMAAHGLADTAALIARAVALDDGNRYLNRSELERAAESMGRLAPELGIVSDLDRTIIPPHEDTLPRAAYPGIVALMRELEHGNGGDAGDTYYVTARSPDRVAELPAWLAEHGLPEGPIATGVSTVPWVAEREKVRDIVEVMQANPEQRFVLLGDSAHRDPEVYREVSRLHPDRVAAAIIHRVNNVNAARVEGLQLVENYAEAAAILLQRGVFDEAQARRVMLAARDEGLAITERDIERLITAHRPG